MRGTIVSLILILLLCTGAGLPASLEGDWVLVEQHYGKGARNIADLEKPVRMKIVLAEGAPQVRIRTSDSSDAGLSWPAWVADDGPVPVQLLERTVDTTAGVIATKYRIVPRDESELILEVTERYSLSVEGESLLGTVVVQFIRDGQPRGAYTLYRTFERGQ